MGAKRGNKKGKMIYFFFLLNYTIISYINGKKQIIMSREKKNRNKIKIYRPPPPCPTIINVKNSDNADGKPRTGPSIYFIRESVIVVYFISEGLLPRCGAYAVTTNLDFLTREFFRFRHE